VKVNYCIPGIHKILCSNKYPNIDQRILSFDLQSLLKAAYVVTGIFLFSVRTRQHKKEEGTLLGMPSSLILSPREMAFYSISSEENC